MNALTLFTIAAIAAYGSCSLRYQGSYGGYPNQYSDIGHQGYTGAYPVSTYRSAVHAPTAYNHIGHAGYNAYPYTPVQSQYHAQDEYGQYSFGYTGGPSTRSETRDAYGVVRGSYDYIDSEGKVQTQHYIADALGFRVSGTNLPVSSDGSAIPFTISGPFPEPVKDTPEVAAAKAAHKAAHDEAAAAAAAASAAEAAVAEAAEAAEATAAEGTTIESDVAEVAHTHKKRSVFGAPHLGVYSPRSFSYGFSAPLSYGYPTYGSYHSYHPYALRSRTYSAYPRTHITKGATLLRVVNNPGHAVSYRVD